MINKRLLPYLLIAPATIFLILLFVVPLVQTIALAFMDNGETSLNNFRKMIGDLNFGLSLRNTFLLVLAVIPLQLGLALVMAMMIQKMGKGRDLVLWIWTIPLGVSDLAAGLVWLAILQNRGYLNTILAMSGLVDGPTTWLSYETPLSLFISVVLAEVWRATAIVLVILVAGLQLIPKEYGEAAEIFGAASMDALSQDHAAAPETVDPDRADPAHGAGLRGVRGRVRAVGAELPGARRRGLCVAACEPE